LQALYLALYVTCMWVLLRRKRQGYVWHISTSTALFLFETLNAALETAYCSRLYLEQVQFGEGQAQDGAMRLEIMSIVYLLLNICSVICL
jgi:diacylglycerol kinase